MIYTILEGKQAEEYLKKKRAAEFKKARDERNYMNDKEADPNYDYIGMKGGNRGNVYDTIKDIGPKSGERLAKSVNKLAKDAEKDLSRKPLDTARSMMRHVRRHPDQYRESAFDSIEFI